MPPWDQTGVPIHFHSSTISGSASCMISLTFASIFPRQSPRSLILWSIKAEADSTGMGFFMCSSNYVAYFSRAHHAAKRGVVCAVSRQCKLYIVSFGVRAERAVQLMKKTIPAGAVFVLLATGAAFSQGP